MRPIYFTHNAFCVKISLILTIYQRVASVDPITSK